MEAVILNFIDDLDSKINGVRTHIDREPDSSSPWTQYHRHYDRYFFKGRGQDKAAMSATPDEVVVREAGQTRNDDKQLNRRPQARFNNTLGEQLKGKNLDLFGGQKQDKSDE